MVISPQPHFHGRRDESDRAFVRRWFLIGLGLRFALMCVIHVLSLGRAWGLTKDAFLYDRTARQISGYWTPGTTGHWPERVTGYFDCSYEYLLGIIYFVVGNDAGEFASKLLNVVAGACIPVVFYKVAQVSFGDRRLSQRVLIWTALFPTQVYYSTIMVRDALSGLAMGFVFYGIACIVNSRSWRPILFLPLGLLLTAGFRFYMFTLLLVLIPAALAGTLLLATRIRSRILQRANAVVLLCLFVGAPLGVQPAVDSFLSSEMTDLEFINRVRNKMNRGSGALYAGSETPEIGQSPLETGEGVLIGVYYFFFSVNPLHLSSLRQVMALPEVLLVLYMIPSLWRGVGRAWRRYRTQLFALVFIAVAITFAYSSVATNAGPMLRWRLQVANVYVMIAALGWHRHERHLASRKVAVARWETRQRVPSSAVTV